MRNIELVASAGYSPLKELVPIWKQTDSQAATDQLLCPAVGIDMDAFYRRRRWRALSATATRSGHHITSTLPDSRCFSTPLEDVYSYNVSSCCVQPIQNEITTHCRRCILRQTTLSCLHSFMPRFALLWCSCTSLEMFLFHNVTHIDTGDISYRRTRVQYVHEITTLGSLLLIVQ